MPRHNFVKAQPDVIEFCRKYNLDYKLKPLWTAFGDIIRYGQPVQSITSSSQIFTMAIFFVCSFFRSLKESGEIWADAWDAHIPRKKLD